VRPGSRRGLLYTHPPLLSRSRHRKILRVQMRASLALAALLAILACGATAHARDLQSKQGGVQQLTESLREDYHKPKGVRCCTCACLKLWLYANARACVRAIVRACVHTPFFVVGFVLGRACVSVCLCVCVHRACVHVHVCVCARVRVNVECVCCV